MESVCAMCGKKKTLTATYSIPPDAIVLMKDSSGIRPDSIAGSVTFSLCEADAASARRMVDQGISPLPECSARYATYAPRKRRASLVKRLISPLESNEDRLEREVARREEMIVTTIIVAAELTQDVDVLQYVPESKVIEAKIVFLSLGELGVLRGPLVDALRNRIEEHP